MRTEKQKYEVKKRRLLAKLMKHAESVRKLNSYPGSYYRSLEDGGKGYA